MNKNSSQILILAILGCAALGLWGWKKHQSRLDEMAARIEILENRSATTTPTSVAPVPSNDTALLAKFCLMVKGQLSGAGDQRTCELPVHAGAAPIPPAPRPPAPTPGSHTEDFSGSRDDDNLVFELVGRDKKIRCMKATGNATCQDDGHGVCKVGEKTLMRVRMTDDEGVLLNVFKCHRGKKG